MTHSHCRPYRNSDTPALAALWNRGTPGAAVARPLSAREFDRRVVSSVLFDAAGLVVAERGGAAVGFAHAGFGPDDPGHDRPGRLATALGSVVMLVVDPDTPEADAVAAGLLAAAETYLRGRGAAVVYAGGQSPVNPFYWGVYGGSECAGVLDDHHAFRRAATAAGYDAVSTTTLLEADLSRPDPFDPRGVLVKRQSQVVVEEDALPSSWWEALALGDGYPTTHRLIARAGGAPLARATTWDMAWFGRADGRHRLGLIDVEVDPLCRRKGYGRHLVNEVLKFARAQSARAVAVQTRSTNAPALALYAAAGFAPVGTATLYRKPG